MARPPRGDGRDPRTVANLKYAKENLKRIPLDVKKEYYSDVIVPAAEMAGLSVRALILTAVEEKIEALKKEGP